MRGEDYIIVRGSDLDTLAGRVNNKIREGYFVHSQIFKETKEMPVTESKDMYTVKSYCQPMIHKDALP